MIEIAGTKYAPAIYQRAPQSVQTALGLAKTGIGHALCHCVAPARKLVIRRINGMYILALWPDDGAQHAPTCAFRRSLEEPIEIYGEPAHTAADSGNRTHAHGGSHQLQLTELLAKWWLSAGLNDEGGAAKGNWGRARTRLLHAARSISWLDGPLAAQCYLPAPFALHRKSRIAALWSAFSQQLQSAGIRRILLIEVKAIEQSKFGYKILARHFQFPIYVDATTLAAIMGSSRLMRGLWRYGDNSFHRAIMLLTVQRSPSGYLQATAGAWMPCAQGLASVSQAWELQMHAYFAKIGVVVRSIDGEGPTRWLLHMPQGIVRLHVMDSLDDLDDIAGPADNLTPSFGLTAPNELIWWRVIGQPFEQVVSSLGVAPV